MSRQRFVLTAALGLFLSLCVETASGGRGPSPVDLIPPGCPALLEILAPKDILGGVLSPALLKKVEELPAYKEAISEPQVKQFLSVVRFLEGRFHTDWRTGLLKLLGGRVTIAAGPRGGSVLFLEGEDPQMLKELHATVRGMAKADAQNKGLQSPVSEDMYKGIQIYGLRDGSAHAFVGSTLVIANPGRLIRQLIERRAAERGRSITALPAYREARRLCGRCAARLFVNLAVLRRNPGLKNALARDANPMASLLFGGLRDVLDRASYLTGALTLGKKSFTVKLFTDATFPPPASDLAFSWPRRPGEGLLPPVEVPRKIASVCLYRDLVGFYSAKDRLFGERTSGLIFFENMMGIFFSGKDITDEIFAGVTPQIEIVVAEQDYTPVGGTPREKLPAFAVVFCMQDPDNFTPVVEEAWQKALGLVNFTRGQQALPGLIIDKAQKGRSRYSYAYFRLPRDAPKEALPSHFNWSPACARAGRYLILSSAKSLTDDLIEALSLQEGKRKPRGGVSSLLELKGAGLHSILKANRENLIRQNMVSGGTTRKEAQTRIDLLLFGLRCLKEATLSVGQEKGRPYLRLRVSFN